MRTFLLAIIAAFILTACGGGGGSSSSGGSTNVGGGSGSASDITISKAALNFNSIQYNAAPETDSFTVRWTDSGVTSVVVGFPPDVPAVDWLNIEFTGIASPLTVTVNVPENRLDVGTHTTTLRVVTGDANDNVVGSRDLQVTYVVDERPQLTIDGPTSVNIFAVSESSDNPIIPVKLTGDGVDWFPSSDEGWINFQDSTGVAPSDTGITIGTSITGPGTFTGTAIFTDAKASDRTATVDVTATFQDQLRFNATGVSDLSFVVAEGASVPENILVSLLGTGVDYVATATESWVVLGSDSGTAVDGLSVGVDQTGLTVGEYMASVIISDSDPNFTQSISFDITLRVEPRRLKAQRQGVGFTETPSLSQLSTSILITDSAEEVTGWTAMSDASWLTVTPSGVTGQPVVLTANPAALPADMLSTATVSVTADDALIQTTRPIQVALWKSASDATADISLNLDRKQLIADPVRPYVYLHSEGSVIDVFNVHSEAIVRSIPDVVAAAGDMAISQDGLTLFVHDTVNGAIIAVDLATDSLSAPFTATINEVFAYGFVDGKGLLFTDANTILDAETGALLAAEFNDGNNPSVTGNANIVVSENGTVLCQMNGGISPATLACYNPSYSYVNGGEASANMISQVNGDSDTASNGIDLAISDDGTQLHSASGGAYAFVTWDPSDLSVIRSAAVDPFTGNVEVASNGLLYGNTSSFSGPDVHSYNDAGFDAGKYNIADGDIARRQMVISSDSTRIVGLTEAGTLEILTID